MVNKRLLWNHRLKNIGSLLQINTKRCFAFFFLIFCFIVFVSIMMNATNYQDDLTSLLKGPISPDYPELLEYIRKRILVVPSSEAYNLLGDANPALLAIENSEHFYNNASKILFKNKMNGFFVEAGALDGETMSNTLTLEVQNKWEGLLIEADPISFETMTTKHRKAWLAHACLSPHSFPQKMLFTSKSQYLDRTYYKTYGIKMRSMHGLASYVHPKSIMNVWFHSIQCLPLESLLLALRVKTVDLLSLDVEGAEWEIIQSLSFEKFDVQVIFLEWKKKEVVDEIKEFLNRKGFKLYQDKGHDFIFVKRDSAYDL